MFKKDKVCAKRVKCYYPYAPITPMPTMVLLAGIELALVCRQGFWSGAFTD